MNENNADLLRIETRVREVCELVRDGVPGELVELLVLCVRNAYVTGARDGIRWARETLYPSGDASAAERAMDAMDGVISQLGLVKQ